MDQPLRILVTLEMQPANGADYDAIRSSLADLAWRAVAEVVSYRYYPVVYTFPGWTDPLEMRDFGFLHAFWPINGFGTLCLRINRTPIGDCIADDLRELIIADTEPAANRSEAHARSPALACIGALLSMPGVVRGMAALLADHEPTPMLVSDAEQGVSLLRKSLLDEISRIDSHDFLGSAIAVVASGMT